MKVSRALVVLIPVAVGSGAISAVRGSPPEETFSGRATSHGKPLPCKRSATRHWQKGETLSITNASPRCSFTFRPSGVQLQIEGTDAVITGPYAARDKSGRLYTYSADGTIALWNPDGTFAKEFGREGGGPGEFRRGVLNLYTTADDQLWVFDASLQRWTVFDSAQRYVTNIPFALYGDIQRSSLLEDAHFVQASSVHGDSATIASYIFDGPKNGRPTVARPVATFGALHKDELPPGRISSAKQRLVADAGGGRVWVGPPRATGRGYELQLWSDSGALLRTIRRDVPWYPANADRDDSNSPAGPGAEVEVLYYLGDGLLFVGLRTPNKHWDEDARALNAGRTHLPTKPGDPLPLARGTDVYLEVIDTDAGTVLASRGPVTIDEALAAIPEWWFPRSRVGCRLVELPDGENTLQLTEAVLIGRE
jgi:hypothetical protein